jgi:Putative polyhydroxyalkanoic acid system protein (PHA_gran_rgn)
MRVTVAHDKGQTEAIRRVNEGADKLFRGAGGAGVEIRNLERSWDANMLNFAFTGKMGPFTAPIRGTVLVTETDLTIDVDLGIVAKFIPEDKIQRDIEAGARKMLEGGEE